jgi:hypothetical protein
LDKIGDHIQYPEGKDQKVRPDFPVVVRIKQTPDVKKGQGAKNKIEGFRIIGNGKHPYNITRIVQKFFEHGHGKGQDQQSLVQICLYFLSPAPDKKPGQKKTLKDPQENNQVKSRYEGIRNHYANVGISFCTG